MSTLYKPAMFNLEVDRWTTESCKAKVPGTCNDIAKTMQELVGVGSICIVVVSSVAMDSLEDGGERHCVIDMARGAASSIQDPNEG